MKLTKYYLLLVFFLTSCGSFEFFNIEEENSVDFSAAENSASQETLAGSGMGLLTAEVEKAKAKTTVSNPQVEQGLQQKPQANARAGAGLFGIDENDKQPLAAPNTSTQTNPRASAGAGMELFGKNSTQNSEQESDNQQNITSTDATLLAESTSLLLQRSSSNCFDLIWLLPTNSVHSYQIKFGQSENNLNGAVTLPIEMLAKAEHPQYGPVYQYQLLCNAAVTQLYVTISAQNSFGSSPQSTVKKLTKK
ncbi:MAG: hypothetical protein IT292_06100 [Deltaproteobacteria bacterium]|nr:hypothetical protein [Deltaproteobacteria bacterium]